MKKTTKLLLIGLVIMMLGFTSLELFTEKIISASLFIASAAFYIETARLMLLGTK